MFLDCKPGLLLHPGKIGTWGLGVSSIEVYIHVLICRILSVCLYSA